MSARTLLATALTAGLGNQWTVVKRARLPELLPKPAVLVYGERLERLSQRGADWVQSTVILWVLAPSAIIDADTLEDRLDAQLLDVLNVIEAHPALSWTTAERLALEGAHPGWKLSLTVLHQITR